MKRRVFITGTGVISPLGNSRESLWAGLSGGDSAIRPLQQINANGYPVSHGAEAWDFSGHINDYGDLPKEQKRAIRKNIKVMCREIQMGVASAQLALADAGFQPGEYDPDRTGVVYGSDYIMTLPEEFTTGVRACLNDQNEFDFGMWAEKGLNEVTPLWLLKYLPNMPASHIAIYNDMRGPNNSLTLREASANLAVGEAYSTIVRGSADRILAGATGTRIHPVRSIHVALQEELAVDGDDPASMCRPFDLNRTGMALGEGAATIMVEEEQAAKEKGSNVLAEVVGQGSSTAVNGEGEGDLKAALSNAIQQALDSSGCDPSDVGHIHAHGLGTKASDLAEAAAISEVFGSQTPVVAAKANIGNLGAGGGIVEMIASVMAMQDGQLFGARNLETPDPDCPVNLSRERLPAGDSFMNLNVTPYGQASAILIRKP